MGSWGERSCDCDDVQDELDKRFNFGPHGAFAYASFAIEEQLPKVKVDKKYNPTLFVGVVVGVLSIRGVVVSDANLNRALNDAKAALKDEEYIKRWTKPKLRIKALRSEIRQFQRRLRSIS